MIITILLTYIICISLVSTSDASIIFVKSNNSTNRIEGNSWSTAFTTIRIAIETAKAGDEIWIAQGTYQETNLKLKNHIRLLGGFSGRESKSIERDWKKNVTRISGVKTQSNPLINGADGAQIDGFTLSDNSYPAILCNGTSPMIINCVIQDNTSENGAGILLMNSNQTIIENCIFLNNFAPSGSALCMFSSSPLIRNCTFTNNDSNSTQHDIAKACILSRKQSSPIFEQCFLIRNSGGGIFAGEHSNLTCNQCQFSWNRSSNRGGAIFGHDSTIKINQCSFMYNTSSNMGGALSTMNCFTSIHDSIFSKNCLIGDQNVGGAIDCTLGETEIINTVFQKITRMSLVESACSIQRRQW